MLIDGAVFERTKAGALLPVRSQTDWDLVDATSDRQVTEDAAKDPDSTPMADEEWAAVEIETPGKRSVGIRLDADVLNWFKSSGRGYQTRINAVLRRYMEAQRKR